MEWFLKNPKSLHSLPSAKSIAGAPQQALRSFSPLTSAMFIDYLPHCSFCLALYNRSSQCPAISAQVRFTSNITYEEEFPSISRRPRSPQQNVYRNCSSPEVGSFAPSMKQSVNPLNRPIGLRYTTFFRTDRSKTLLQSNCIRKTRSKR